LRIGEVEKLTLVAKEYLTDRRYIMVRASIFPDVFRLKKGQVDVSVIPGEVKEGLRARLGFQGLTGTAHLELDYFDPRHYSPLKIDWKPLNVHVPSVPSRITRIGEALDSIMRSLEQINMGEFTRNLQKSVSTLTKILETESLDRIGGDMRGLIAEVRETNRRIDQLLKRPEIGSILADASAAAAAARRIAEGSEEPLNQLATVFEEISEDVNKVSKSLDALSADAPESLARIRRILQRLDNLISGQQQDIQVTIENMRLVSENLRELTDNARRYPSQILFGEPPAHSVRGGE
jgi:ABC-type transporter Mla subunit MlaD